MQKNRGFTLLEMLVIIALILIMTAILLARTGGMQREAQLQIATTDIVALIREARQDSVAIQGISAGVVTEFPSYGVHFDVAASGQAIVFADCVADDSADTVPSLVDNDDLFYYDQANCGAISTTRQTYTLPTNIRIDRIEATYPSGGSMTTSQYNEVSILFLRPEPTIWITVRDGGGRSLIPAGYVDVVLEAIGTGDERTVRFSSNGLVSVE